MTEIEKTIVEQLADLVQRKPQRNDISFSVGPEKIKVAGVKIILEAASPVFEKEFEANHLQRESAGMKDEREGIPLPEVDPTAFELFIRLIISDTWSADDLNKLSLGPTTAINLLGLCRRFEITKAIKAVEAAADASICTKFLNIKDSEEFLEMPREHLETILSCERIPLEEKEVFECASRWAAHQCLEKKLELTGQNFRNVLGSCFFEIRFPTMKAEDFWKVSLFKEDLFTDSEKLKFYEFMAMDEDAKAMYDKTLLRFKTNPRKFTTTAGDPAPADISSSSFGTIPSREWYSCGCFMHPMIRSFCSSSSD